MAFNSETYQVMIASPGDVEKERQMIRDVIYEWNAINSKKESIVLLPVGWETHSSPEMGKGAQEILNEQILEMCDLLVGVFWTRLGTPTQHSPSGTVEEIRNHVKQGKPTMLYFSSQPVQPDSIDREQYDKLLQFRDECKEKGLYQVYDSLSEFKDKFRTQLNLKVFNNDYFNIQNKKPLDQISEMNSPSSNYYLSNEAKILLTEAASSNDGTILMLHTMEGLIIETNGKQFGEINNARSEANWEDAIEALNKYGLIQDRGYKREVFSVTRFGYEYSDTIK